MPDLREYIVSPRDIVTQRKWTVGDQGERSHGLRLKLQFWPNMTVDE